MERKLVTIQQIEELKSISGADKIDTARIKGWWVVVQKDQFKVGDEVIYYEIDSFLPLRPEYDFLLKGGKPKKMIYDGKEIEGIRLRTVKLRGQLSQGLIMPMDVLTRHIVATDEDGNIMKAPEVGDDITDIMGVKKYEAPIPACLAGKVKGSFPSFIPKTDEERIQNFSGVLNNFYVSEKLDGSSVSYFKKDGEFGVCSRNLELAEGDTTQWRIARELDLENKLPDGFAIQGELIGQGINKNLYKLNGQEVYFFNTYNIKSGVYLNYEDFIGFCNSLGLKTVPIIDDNFSLLKTVDEFLEYAEGKSKLNSDVEREGVVVRPKMEMQYCGQRLSFKIISNRFLLKNE